MKAEATTTIRFKAAVPQFTVSDVVHTAEYYRDVLGFQIAGYWDGQHASLSTAPPPIFAIVHRDDVQVFFSRADQAPQRRFRAAGANDAYFNIAGVDALAAEFQRRKAEVLDGPVDRVYQQRELVVRDCNGLVLTFAEDTSGRAI